MQTVQPEQVGAVHNQGQPQAFSISQPVQEFATHVQHTQYQLQTVQSEQVGAVPNHGQPQVFSASQPVQVLLG